MPPHTTRRPHALSVVATLALAGVTRAQVGSSDDLWDCSRGAVVIGHTPFDDTHHGYDARDAFGGNFHDFPAALGAVIFADFRPAGSVHSIEWRAAAPIDLERFMLAVAGDTHGDTRRATSGFRLFGRDEAGAPWMLLYEQTRDPQEVLTHPIWTIDHEFRSARRRLIEFRAEFVQACERTDYGGPRVIELDGFGEYSGVPAQYAGVGVPTGSAREAKLRVDRRGAEARKLKPGPRPRRPTPPPATPGA